MKKYIQLTAGRGPVECARAVTLVARELLKDFPDAELVESEPHNTEPDCYMSMLFLAETDAAKEKEWNGTVLWRATSNRYRPGYSRKVCFKLPCMSCSSSLRALISFIRLRNSISW